jgi:predicted GNAT family acetyltransferase
MGWMTAPSPHLRATDLDIHHDPARSCFECDVDGLRCVIDYRLIGGVMHIDHTEVPPELEGRGIAAALVRFALAHAREHGLKINPLCSYVRVYMQRHADTQDLRA